MKITCIGLLSILVGIPCSFAQDSVEPQGVEFFDYGDAPQPYPTGGNTPQGVSPQGEVPPPAFHDIFEATIFMGTVPTDDELDGQPSEGAVGDDQNGDADEDGVMFENMVIPSDGPPPIAQGGFGGPGGPSMYVLLSEHIGPQQEVSPAGNPGCFINAWIDFNQNGSWEDPGDQVVSDLLRFSHPDPYRFGIIIPPDALLGPTYARVRCSGGELESSGGPAIDGEVEDHVVILTSNTDFGDAPLPYPTSSQTPPVSSDTPSPTGGGGPPPPASHDIVEFAPYLGMVPPDAEPDGIPSPYARGDDLTGVDDEDGVIFSPMQVMPIIKALGSASQGEDPNPVMQVLVSAIVDDTSVTPQGVGPYCLVSAWIDFAGDSAWDPEDTVVWDMPVAAGDTAFIPIVLPIFSLPGDTFARVRCASVEDLGPFGPAPDGEVEDYLVTINDDQPPNVVLSASADPNWVYAPGGTVTYSLQVSNPGPGLAGGGGGTAEAFTLTDLQEATFGSVNGSGDCSVPQFIPGGGSYNCSFEAPANLPLGGGGPIFVSRTFAAFATDNVGIPNNPELSAQTVDVEVIIPQISLSLGYTHPPPLKSDAVNGDISPQGQAPLEPVGEVQWNLTITNQGKLTWDVTALGEETLGSLDGVGTCNIGAILSPPQPAPQGNPTNSYSCSFVTQHDANEGDPISQRIGVALEDPDNVEVLRSDEVGFVTGDRQPSITVSKTANPTSVPFGGGMVTYTLLVTNDNAALENVTLTSVSDDVFGTVAGTLGDCPAVQYVIGTRDGNDSETYSCSFEEFVDGAADSQHVNEITVGFQDDDENLDTDSDSASVDIGSAPDEIFEDSFEAQPKFVFSTSTTYDGDLKTAGAGATGLEGADNLCNERAAHAGLPGTYTAWLSADSAHARDRISQGNGPYYKPDGKGGFGELVADDLADILSNEEPSWPGAFLKSSINKDESGASASGEPWTDTRENGNLWGNGLKSACQNWTTAVGTSCEAGGGDGCGRVGRITNSAVWTNNTQRSCDTLRRLYCIQD